MGLEVISEDPYGSGWILKLRVGPGVEEERKNLLSPEEYRKLLEEQV